MADCSIPQMTFCALCKRQMVDPAGKGPDGEELCGACFKSMKRAIQRSCQHQVMKADGYTCVDCGARPFSLKRFVFRTIGAFRWVGVSLLKFVVMYTLPAIIAAIVSVGLTFYLLHAVFGIF
jgi:hypothetical protein